MNTPVNPFFYIKVGCKGVYITRTCLHDVLDFLFVTMYFQASFHEKCLFKFINNANF